MPIRSTSLMLMLVLCTIVAPLVSAEGTRPDPDIERWVDAHLHEVVALYQHLHRNPELSLEEEKTAALATEKLASYGYQVQAGIGGHGVVAVLENGAGPTILVRGDTDALPVTEETGLPYASQVRTIRPDGSRVGVMHACGHDVHTANLIATAELLVSLKERWSGTLVIIAQPAEELGRGALAMMNDGLFDKIPRPDTTLALHVESNLPAGSVGLTPGWAFANVDSVNITIYGRGGHGARPHTTIDPIVTAAYLVTELQTLVSRRIDPLSPAVVTVGSIHGGHKSNVIPNEVKLQLTVRSYSDEVRNQLITGIAQLAQDTCRSFQCPQEADVTLKEEFTPSVYNDPALVARAREVFTKELGADKVIDHKPSMGGEDFGRYGRKLEVPSLLFRLGSVEGRHYEASLEPGATPLPSLHSSRYQPDGPLTLGTGIRSLGALLLDLFAQP